MLITKESTGEPTCRKSSDRLSTKKGISSRTRSW
jgi:hypothetical protein